MQSTDAEDKRTVVIMSDSTGETASRAAKVALEQFFGITSSERRFVNIRTPQGVDEALHYAVTHQAFVVYTLVESSLRMYASRAIRETGLPAFDLLQDLLQGMQAWIGREPGNEPGHKIGEEYFARMSAIGFVEEHDDGKRPHDAASADVLVLGLSRTSKTPVCHWLGFKGIRAANIPLVLETAPPQSIFGIDPRRVFVLSMRTQRLHGVRLSRWKEMSNNTAEGSYTDPQAIAREQDMIARLVLENPGWTSVDVSMRAIEETASFILSEYQKRFGNGH